MRDNDPCPSARDGLPPEFGYLAAELPRADWGARPLHPTASHWLMMHEGFRAGHRAFADLAAAWRGGRMDAPGLRQAIMPRLQQHLNHLDGHHRIESGHYFPAMARAEPRMARGFELLDRDHHWIEDRLLALVEAANAFNHAIRDARPADRTREAGERFLDALEGLTAPMERHLEDEEDIVIPLLTLRGDPVG